MKVKTTEIIEDGAEYRVTTYENGVPVTTTDFLPLYEHDLEVREYIRWQFLLPSN